jgi:hypothetical protein
MSEHHVPMDARVTALHAAKERCAAREKEALRDLELARLDHRNAVADFWRAAETLIAANGLNPKSVATVAGGDIVITL